MAGYGKNIPIHLSVDKLYHDASVILYVYVIKNITNTYVI